MAGPLPTPAASAQSSWSREKHHLACDSVLTEDSPRAVSPKGFQGRLWAPQATLLQAMLDVESRPFVRMYSSPNLLYREPCNPLLQISTARIAAEFSFGKTVLCIALVCASPRPQAYPRGINLCTMDSQSDSGPNHLAVEYSRAGNSNKYHYKVDGRGSLPQLTVRHRRLIPATLVVAAPSVISQWENCIRTFAPHLNFFTIENVKTLRSFHDMFQTRDMASIDLVLMKAGKVTSSFQVKGETVVKKGQRALTLALAKATEGHVWSRMIVDDFDTIRLASDDIFLPSLFTWVISATQRTTVVRPYFTAANTPEEFIRQNSSVPILSAASDRMFNAILKLHCSDDYVRNHINSTTVRFRRIVVEGGNAVGILLNLGVADDIVEMAAVGAVETAAERLGIKANNVGDIVARVLADQTSKYQKSIRVLDRVRRCRSAAIASRHPADDKDDVKDIRNTLKKGSNAEADELIATIGRISLPLTNALNSLEDWATRERETYGGRLQRMRDNVRQECCQACMVPIEDESYIVNCCQIVICGFCTIIDGGRAKRYIDRCPNCAAAVQAQKDLIYVGTDLELEDALSDKALLGDGDAGDDEAPESSSEDEEADEVEADKYAPWNGDARLRALLQLLDNDPVTATTDESTDPFVTGLLEGRVEKPMPPGHAHKYLIFTMHAESTRAIAAGLGRMGIPFLHLSGTRQKKDEAVRTFKAAEGANIMIATSSRDCAGLHLPEVTRLVLYHRHVDNNIAEQAVGRAQRVGREYSLEVIELMNEGEYHAFGG